MSATVKDARVTVEVELPVWLLKRANLNSATRRVLEEEVGREVINRGIKGTRK